MKWYEKASVYWPWLVSKEIDIIQFKEHRDDGGHNQWAAKLTFKLLGFKVGQEHLLVCNAQSPSWGLDWEFYPVGSLPSWRCMSFKENVMQSLEKWYEHVEKQKEYTAKSKARELDRGTFVSKYTH